MVCFSQPAVASVWTLTRYGEQGSLRTGDTSSLWALDDLLLSLASLMLGLHLNNICTWLCIQFVCCEITRSASSSNRLLLCIQFDICHQIRNLIAGDKTPQKYCVLYFLAVVDSYILILQFSKCDLTKCTLKLLKPILSLHTALNNVGS